MGITPTVQITMTFKRVVVDEVNRATAVLRGASGKSVNVARVLTNLGEKATCIVPVGGETGRFMQTEMDSAGIANRCVQVAGITRTCITAIDLEDHTATELVQEAARMTGDEAEECLRVMRGLLPETKMLILSGSLAPDVNDDFYAKCCEAAKNAGVPVILDARGNALKLAMKFKPMIVKPNRHELADTIGSPINDDADLRKAMTAIVQMGAKWVIITQGKAGAMISDGQSFWRAPAIDIDPISSIGSGDAFTAGLAAAISHGKSVPEACHLATACAAANALVPGSGILRMEDVKRLEPMARVERV